MVLTANTGVFLMGGFDQCKPSGAEPPPAVACPAVLVPDKVAKEALPAT